MIYDSINWAKLKKQKLSLITTINLLEDEGCDVDIEHLEGILHLIDALQDEAEEQGYSVEWLEETKA